MDTAAWIILGIAIAIVLVMSLLVVLRSRSRRRRRGRLQDRFGPEYDRAVDHDRRSRAERVLEDRAERRDRLDIRPLSTAARTRYVERWHDVQAEFVDRPQASVSRADELVREVMAERGYPVDDADERTDLLSVDYPELVEHYRAARDLARRNDRRQASTEELRNAVVHCRWLFEALLEEATARR
jgi:hypothetical protein